MSASMRVGLHGYMSLLGIFVVACGDGATAPARQNAAANRAASAPVSFSAAKLPAVTLTGRIVYTTGSLAIYNLATKTTTSLRISGVNPKFSPDGTRITYQNGGVYIVNSDGTNGRLVTATGNTPNFDPTGTKITFDNNPGIWKINADGTGLTQLTTVGRQPAWSPDGTQIVYHAPVGGIAQLFVMNADGTNPHQVLTSGSVLDVVWQPSAKVLFGNSGDLYSYDPTNTTSLTRLTTSGSGNDEPSWSPDATHISWTDGTTGKTAGIWIMNADGTGKQGPVISKGRQGSWGK